jgi:hypothetical protein
MPEDLAILGDDADVEIGDKDDDALVAMWSSDVDVMELASVVKGH